MNPWLWLSAAVVLEVAGTSFLKLSNGLTRFWPTIFMFFFYGLAFVGLSMAIRHIDVSVAYAVWSGVGIILITFVDIFVFRTHLTGMMLFAIALIMVGAVMLKYLSPH